MKKEGLALFFCWWSLSHRFHFFFHPAQRGHPDAPRGLPQLTSVHERDACQGETYDRHILLAAQHPYTGQDQYDKAEETDKERVYCGLKNGACPFSAQAVPVIRAIRLHNLFTGRENPGDPNGV